jgi:hypothetical protein
MGCLVLVVFLSGVFRLGGLGGVIPWIMAFNAAMTGYSLIEKTRDQLQRKHLGAVCAGAATGIVSFLALNLLFIHWIGFFFLDFLDLLIFLGVGMAFSEMGALLAIKYFGLKGNDAAGQ